MTVAAAVVARLEYKFSILLTTSPPCLRLPEQADAYTLPAMRVGGAGFDPADAVLLNETAVNNIVEAVGENGEVVEIESVTVQFAL